MRRRVLWLTIGLASLVGLSAVGFGLDLRVSRDAADEVRVSELSASEAKRLTDELWREPLETGEREPFEFEQSSKSPPENPQSMGRLRVRPKGSSKVAETSDPDPSSAAPFRVVDHWPDPPRVLSRAALRPRHSTPRFSLRPLLFVAFNRPIRDREMVDSAFLWNPPNYIGVRRVRLDDVPTSHPIRRLIEEHGAQHSVVFTPRKPLDPDMGYEFGIKEGASAADGAGELATRHAFEFRTVSPLSASKTRCTREDPCSPGESIQIRFNNLLDPGHLRTSHIRLPPDLKGAEIRVRSGRAFGLSNSGSLFISADFQPNKTYTMSLSEDVRDVHGQTLGERVKIDAHFGARAPSIDGAPQSFAMLRPSETLDFRTTNVQTMRLRVARVERGQFAQYIDWRGGRGGDDSLEPPFQRGHRQRTLAGDSVVVDRVIEVDADPSDVVETRLDPSTWSDEPDASYVVDLQVLEFGAGLNRPSLRSRAFVTWVEISDLGVDVQHADDHMQAWVTDMSTGHRVEGARVRAVPGGGEAETDNNGMATVPNNPGRHRDDERGIVVEHNNDTVFVPFELPDDYTSAGPSVGRAYERAGTRLYLNTDRAVYRPGDVVSVAGIARAFDPSGTPRVTSLRADKDVTLKARRGEKLLALASAEMSEHGMFALDFALPPDIAPGGISIQLELPDGTKAGASVDVGTAVEPYLVQSMKAQAGPLVADDAPAFEARFWRLAETAGRPISATWQIDTKDTNFVPPHWSSFEFGNRWPDSEYEEPSSATSSRSGAFDTPLVGSYSMDLTAESDDPAVPRELVLETRVTDGAGIDISREITREVLPADALVGLNVARRGAVPGQPLDVEAIAVDAQGIPIDGARVEVVARRMVWTFDDWEWSRKPVSRSRCRFKSDGEPHTCRFDADKSGTYKFTARVRDARNRLSETVIARYVSAGPWSIQTKPDLPQLQITPDKSRYQIGDTAKLTILSPLEQGQGLVSYQLDGRPVSQSFELEGGKHTLEFEVTEGHAPHLSLAVQVVSDATTDSAPWPSMAVGSARLQVARDRELLQVAVEPGAADESTGKPHLIVDVSDADGEAVEGAEVLAFVSRLPTTMVGEHDLGDPIGALVPRPDTRVGLTHSREWRPVPPGAYAAPAAWPRGKSLRLSPYDPWPPKASKQGLCCNSLTGPPWSRSGGVDMPAGWNPYSTILPIATTGKLGRAHVEVPIDASPGEYRVFAIAAAGPTEIGTVERTVSSAALMPAAPAVRVKPAIPDSLVVGETGEIGVLVENVADATETLELVMRTAGVESRGAAARRVELPPASTTRIAFEVAADAPGRAEIQVGWKGSGQTGSQRADVAVTSASSTERVVRYGKTDGALRWGVEVADEQDGEVGGLEVTIANSPVLHLFDAFRHASTTDRDGANVDELTSRILAKLRLLEVRDAFSDDSLPSREALRASIATDIYHLEQVLEPSKQSRRGVPGSLFDVDDLYRTDGWPRTPGLWPFLRLRVVEALARAHKAGIQMSRTAGSRAGEIFAQTMRSARVIKDKKVARTLRAYGHYVSAIQGVLDRPRAVQLASMNPATSLTPDAAAWLVLALVHDPETEGVRDGLVRYLVGTLELEDGVRTLPRRTNRHYAVFESDARTEALILSALVAHGTDESVANSLMQGLLERRVDGQWRSPQQNAWAIDAIVRYAEAYPPASGTSGARLWLDGKLGHRLLVKGDVPDSDAFAVEAADLASLVDKDSNVPLMLEPTGPRALYYRIALELAVDEGDAE